MSEEQEVIIGNLGDIVDAAKGERKKVLVTSHYNPDGDAIGATLSLGLLLEELGHEVFFFNRDPIPELFDFLPGAERIQNAVPDGARYDITYVIDVFDLARTGLDSLPRERLGKIHIIDHHRMKPGEKHGDLVFIDPTAAASGVLVYRFAKLAGLRITPTVAWSIYCSIMTDTGSFHYSSATPEAFRATAEMVEIGVKPWEFAQRVYESHPLNRIQLLTEVLKTLEVDATGRYASVYVEHSTLGRYGAGSELTDGFINYPRSIKGVEVAMFLRGLPEGGYKASLRSAGHVDVREICEPLGGGGHRNAAGCVLTGPLTTARAKLYQATEGVLKRVFAGKDRPS